MPEFLSNNPPQKLLSDGPILDVEILLPLSASNIRGTTPSFRTKALIDTGATSTCISSDVAKNLKLIPIGQVYINGATGKALTNCYAVDFTFPGSGIKIENCKVMEVDLHVQNFDMLIGRDILSIALFSYDGLTGTFLLQIPSNTHPLNSPPKTTTTSNASKKKSNKNRKRSRASRKKKK